MYLENCQCARCDNVETCIRVDNDELVCADCCKNTEDKQYNLDDEAQWENWDYGFGVDDVYSPKGNL